MTRKLAYQLTRVGRVYREKSTPQRKLALGDINLDILESEFLAVAGPSGSGKSTLLSILGCLDTITSGEMQIFGESIITGDRSQQALIRREQISFVFQNYKLLPFMNVLENVAYPLLFRHIKPKHRRARAEHAIEQLGLSDLMARMPSQLSGGQQQRVAVARAMTSSPKILIADEPTGALDRRNSDLIVKIFDEMRTDGVTIIMATHDANISAAADRTISLEDGFIVKK